MFTSKKMKIKETIKQTRNNQTKKQTNNETKKERNK